MLLQTELDISALDNPRAQYADSYLGTKKGFCDLASQYEQLESALTALFASKIEGTGSLERATEYLGLLILHCSNDAETKRAVKDVLRFRSEIDVLREWEKTRISFAGRHGEEARLSMRVSKYMLATMDDSDMSQQLTAQIDPTPFILSPGIVREDIKFKFYNKDISYDMVRIDDMVYGWESWSDAAVVLFIKEKPVAIAGFDIEAVGDAEGLLCRQLQGIYGHPIGKNSRPKILAALQWKNLLWETMVKIADAVEVDSLGIQSADNNRHLYDAAILRGRKIYDELAQGLGMPRGVDGNYRTPRI